ncbi:MAG: hypothetical protein GWP91_00880 [Rhodobacterales bacterium]|nr:hypothetical protein [Rhodobacterales bacterium]
MLIWTLFSPAIAGDFQKVMYELDIDAPPTIVWEVLTEFENYKDWNPWLVEAYGVAKEGATCKAVVWLNGEKRKANHKVLVVEDQSRFVWRDLGWFTPLARGQRARTLTPLSGGTHFRSELMVTGVLAGTVEAKYRDTMNEGLKSETIAIKQISEERAKETAAN